MCAEVRVGAGLPETVVSSGCELPRGDWESNPGLL